MPALAILYAGVPISCRSRKPLYQTVEKLRLSRIQLLARLVDAEPAGAVDLGELRGAPGARRPLHRERVAAHGVGVEVALGGPGGHDLAALLLHVVELDQLARRQGRARLLLELPQRAGERIVAVLVLALRDRPDAGVPASPEGTARMHKQDFRAAAPVEEDARAALRPRPHAAARGSA